MSLREGVNGSCSPKDLETMLQLNYLYFTEVRKDESAFNAYISTNEKHDQTYEGKSADNLLGYPVKDSNNELTKRDCHSD